MALRELIQELCALELEDRGFDDWLSPDVVNLLITHYAERSPEMGTLQWEYASLGSTKWGSYSPERKRLFVNKAKTKGLFKQQVNTILHEIQHWNQHVEAHSRARAAGHETPDAGTALHRKEYDWEKSAKGYWDSKFEVDARAFADRYVDDAMKKIGAVYSGTVGGTLDDTVEELFDEFGDAGKVTRLQIGQALKARGMNTPANHAEVTKQLKDLGMQVV